VKLLDRKDTFHRDPALSSFPHSPRQHYLPPGREAGAQLGGWKKMPVLADFQEVARPSPAR